MVDTSQGPRPGDYDELALAELVARYVGHLLDDPGRQPGPLPGPGRPESAEPARAAALQRLALGTAIAGRVQAGWALDAVAALRAGASWGQVAQARGQVVPAVQAELAGWLRGQARLQQRTGLGLDPAEAAQARRLLDPPRPAGHRTTDTAPSIDGPGL